jgi:hypothetical protein
MLINKFKKMVITKSKLKFSPNPQPPKQKENLRIPQNNKKTPQKKIKISKKKEENLGWAETQELVNCPRSIDGVWFLIFDLIPSYVSLSNFFGTNKYVIVLLMSFYQDQKCKRILKYSPSIYFLFKLKK